jgi:hypothetical protein
MKEKFLGLVYKKALGLADSSAAAKALKNYTQPQEGVTCGDFPALLKDILISRQMKPLKQMSIRQVLSNNVSYNRSMTL